MVLRLTFTLNQLTCFTLYVKEKESFYVYAYQKSNILRLRLKKLAILRLRLKKRPFYVYAYTPIGPSTIGLLWERVVSIIYQPVTVDTLN